MIFKQPVTKVAVLIRGYTD